MSKEETKYEAAFAQLQEIVQKMESDTYSIDEIDRLIAEEFGK